jgi:hypothetical protein
LREKGNQVRLEREREGGREKKRKEEKKKMRSFNKSDLIGGIEIR